MMKKSFICLVVLLMFCGVNKSYSQWTTSGTVLYTPSTNKVAIGTSTAPQRFNVAGSSYFSGVVGVGDANPRQSLSVKGKISLADGSPENKADEGYNGALMITKGVQSGQYINLVRWGMSVWSIGTVYNSGIFAIGTGKSTDSQFTQPFFTIHNVTGNVGIGTTNPTQALSVKGRVSMSPVGTEPAEAYKGSLVVTQPKASGQYINLVRDGMYPWSIGTVYNANTFAIGQGQGTDANFTQPYFVIKDVSGNVGIGTTNPGTKLDVAGTIRAYEVKVCLNQGCDFVFAPDYDLMPLHELDSFISENKHLPEVAPAAVMEAEGISLSEMNAKLLQKIEELTLYMIAQDKKTAELEKEIEMLKLAK